VRVERFESALWQTSSLLVVVDDTAVAIDPCISRAEVETLAGRAAALGARVTNVLITHADWDRVAGIAAFPEAVAAMGPATARAIESGAPAERVELSAREFGLDVAGPPRIDRVLAPGVAHRIGPVVVETLALGGHTPDGVGYRIREAGVLAVGDHLSTAEFPFASSTAAYRGTLAALIDLLRNDPPELVVPGHGPALGADDALEVAEADLAYLHELHAAVRGALDDTGSTDRARAAGLAVAPPREAPTDLLRMHAGNVEAQLEELIPATTGPGDTTQG
jgi:hydroxyacylglutathione hydrolase